MAEMSCLHKFRESRGPVGWLWESQGSLPFTQVVAIYFVVRKPFDFM